MGAKRRSRGRKQAGVKRWGGEGNRAGEGAGVEQRAGSGVVQEKGEREGCVRRAFWGAGRDEEVEGWWQRVEEAGQKWREVEGGGCGD